MQLLRASCILARGTTVSSIKIWLISPGLLCILDLGFRSEYLDKRHRKLSHSSMSTSYRRINADFESAGGNKLPMACFYETVKTPTMVWTLRSPHITNIKAYGEKELLVSRPDATFSITSSEVVPLDSKHAELSIFDYPGSQNLSRVTSAIQELYKQVLNRGTSSALLPQRPPSAVVPDDREWLPGLKVLALGLYSLSEAFSFPFFFFFFGAHRANACVDGGGIIRGMFGIIVLWAIMEEVRKLDCPESTTLWSFATTLTSLEAQVWQGKKTQR
jgi:hypothetical protein